MVSRWRMGVVVSGAMLLSACGGGGGGAEVNGDVLTGKQTTYSLGGVVTGLSTGTLTLANAADGRALDTLQIVGTGATELSFTFAKELPTQTGYAISVVTSPSGLGCSVVNGSSRTNTAAVTNIQINCEPNAYNVSGTVTGLVGSGLQLKNNATDTLNVAASTPVGTVPFNFPTALNGAASYAVTVATQPVNPTQNCVVTNGSGAGTGSNINTVTVSCTTQSFTVGGSIAGLTGTGLQLQNNGGSTLTLTPGATSFAFPAILSGTTYNVTVVGPTTNPIQNCVVSPATASGTVGGSAITSVVVNCNTNTYTVGGTVTGLGSNNSGLQLQLSKNGSVVETKPIAGDGGFAFSQTLTDGNTYSVAISTFHSHYVCTLTNASGPISGSNVSNVGVSCVAPIVVTVSGLGASNAGLVLSNSYGTSSANTTRAVETLTIAGDGAFQFSTRLPSARAYTITVSTPHPDYQCTISNGDSFVGAAPINITVACTERTYTIGGTVNGLATSSTGLVLRRIATGYANEDLTITPTGNPVDFTFLTKLPTNRAFTIIEVSEPDDRLCAFTNTTNSTTGTINRANVTNIVMNCTVPAALTVSSIAASGTTLVDNATNLALAAQPQLTFSAPLDNTTINGGNVVLSTTNGAHPAALGVNGNLITIQPDGKLMPSTTYTLTITPNIRGTNKERLAASFVRTFSTSSGWTVSQNIGVGSTYTSALTSGVYGSPAQIKYAANGNAVAIWNAVISTQYVCDYVCDTVPHYSLYSRRYNAATDTWSAIEVLLSNADTATAQLNVDSAGNALVVWSTLEALWERRFSVSTGTWSAAQSIPLNGRHIIQPSMAMDLNGNAWLITLESGSLYTTSWSVYQRRYTAETNWTSSTWGNAELLESDSAPIDSLNSLRVVMTSNGVATAAWLQGTYPNINLYASRNTTSDTANWSTPVLLRTGDANNGIFDFNIATVDSGDSIATWSQGDNTTVNMYARRYNSITGWDVTINLGAGSASDYLYRISPCAAVGMDGNATAVWSNASGIQLKQFISGAWNETRQLDGVGALYPALFMDSLGNLSILWAKSNAFLTTRYTISTGVWTPPQQIDAINGDVLFPAVAVGPSGSALALWNKNNSLYSSRFIW